MPCEKIVTHVVRTSDTIYQIAKMYDTTVPEILIRNQGINPYNLKVDARLTICSKAAADINAPDELTLNQELRKAWIQLAYWTRMYLLSVAGDRKDKDAVNQRLNKIPAEMSKIFLKYYPGSVTYQLEQEWVSLINNSAALINAAKNNNVDEANELDGKIVQNVDNIASLLSNMNINYDQEEIKKILEEFMVLTKRQVVARLEGQYEDDIQIFDELENQAVKAADYLTNGIVKQYMGSGI